MPSINLKQEVKTSLKLGASMVQSIKTLQLATSELEEYIDAQLVDNPFLDKEEVNEIEFKPLYDCKISTTNWDADYDPLAQLENRISLKEHVLMQIPHLLDPQEILIGNYLTDYLDEDGYLRIDLNEASQILKLSLAKLEEITRKLQTLEPSGIFARNLKESLTIQLQESGKYSKSYEILLNHLDLLAKGDLPKLTKLIGIGPAELKIMIHEIKLLEPKPGRQFADSIVSVKLPDVHITLDTYGNIQVFPSKENSIILRVNHDYYENIIGQIKSKNEKKPITEMMQKAVEIAQSVDMRGKTIVYIAHAIAKEQEEFFRRGILYLKPLTLAKIAQQTGYDESTVSRATSNKYAATPYGVIDMKFFFSSGVKSKYSQEEVSSHKVKEIIKTLIGDETPGSPLSDEEISLMLKQFNIIAARRTVAKYRESLKIPSSSKRKKVSY